MGTGYTRNDTSNNIADGNIINAADLDGEFDAIESAFGTSGHTHDGTSAEGGAITVLGPVQDFVASATEIKPKTTNTLDIGTNSLLFKDMFLDGVATLGSIKIDNAGTIGSASDGDAIAISSGGVVTFSQAPLVDVTNATTNAVTDVLGIRVQSTGTPAVGIGSGFTLGVETAAGNVETGGAIRIVSTGLTPTDEEIDLVFYSMRNGSLTEAFRFDSSADSLSLNDSVDLSLGSDDDLTLVHSGAHGTVTNSTGNLTFDVAGDIILDADGGDIVFNNNGVEVGRFTDSSTDLVIKSAASDQDMLFKGNDGGSVITALTLDMSNAGFASFNNGITLKNELYLNNADASATVGYVYNDSNNFVIRSYAQDKDLIFKGNDGSSVITALTLDMSEAGAATFNSAIGVGSAASTGYAVDVTGLSGYDDIMRLTAVGTNIGARINLTSTGTGVNRINATNNELALQTGGVSRMTIDSSGNVGIGCTPDQKLHVKGTTEIQATNSTNGWQLYTYTDNTFRVNYNGAGADEFVIESGGNIGIGTSNPIADLSIVDSSTGSGIEIQPEVTTDTNRITNYDRVESAYKKFRLDASEQQFYISGSERMSIDSSGRVLLGHTSSIPVEGNEQKLQLVSSNADGGITIARFNNNFGPYLSFGRSGSGTIGNYTAVPVDDELGRIQWGVADGTDMASIGASISAFTEELAASNDVPSRLVFSTTANNASTPTERMRISSAGDVELIQSNNLYWKHQGGGTIRAGITADSSDNLTFSTGSSDTTHMTLDGSGRLLLGTATTSNAHANANNLIIGNVPASGVNAGLTIVSGNDANGAIHFSDGTASGNANIQGQLVYEHANNAFLFYTAVTERMRITSTGSVLEVLGNSTSRNTITDTMTVNGGTAVAHPYSGFGFGIQFKGDDYSNVQRNYGAIYTVMDDHTSSTTTAGDAGFQSRMDFYINRGGTSTTDPTQQMFIKSDGDVHITDGNLVVANGHGIDFSATGDGSGTTSSELLDDYEEGTWTPTLFGGTTAGTMTGNTAGRYTKIGNQVFLEFRIDGVTLSGAAGTLQISGLPFTSSYGTNNTYSVATVTQMHNFAFTTDSRQSLYPTNGGVVLYGLESRNANTWVDWTVTNTSNLYMNVNMFYVTTQ